MSHEAFLNSSGGRRPNDTHQHIPAIMFPGSHHLPSFRYLQRLQSTLRASPPAIISVFTCCRFLRPVQQVDPADTPKSSERRHLDDYKTDPAPPSPHSEHARLQTWPTSSPTRWETTASQRWPGRKWVSLQIRSVELLKKSVREHKMQLQDFVF